MIIYNKFIYNNYFKNIIETVFLFVDGVKIYVKIEKL